MYPLQVTSLSKQFISKNWPFCKPKPPFLAVDDISFTLQKGEILGFLGPNGAGKTTTIQMLLGTLNPTTGSISYFGKNFYTHRTDTLKKVTFASSYIKLPSKLTVLQNLDVAGRLYYVPDPERTQRIETLLKKFDIWHLRNMYSGSLSAGQATRVMLVKAFLPNPNIVLLDEPTASLDPDVAQEVRTFAMQQSKESGTSILFTSHNMDEVTQVCNRVIVLKQGKIIADSTPLALAATISKAHVHLTLTSGVEDAITFAQQHKLSYRYTNTDFSLELEEANIGTALIALAQAGVIFTTVSIDKPTLEDYFLTIARKP